MTGQESYDTNGEDQKHKLSHKKWRALQKKLKRKSLRQVEAQRRDAGVEQETQRRESLPAYQAYNAEQEYWQRQREEQEQRQRQWQESMWLERERIAHVQWLAKKDRQEKEKQRLEEEERRIKEEWEDRQKKEKEEEEEIQRKEKERKDKQDALLKEATSNAKSKDGSTWHNPLAPPGVERQVENCTFFVRTGACRFGIRCSRYHPDPENSTVILFAGMYAHFALDQSMVDEYDTDIALEYEDGESYQHFREFYEDTLPEFKKIGKVTQFKVCCNFEPHLRGNVYVQYKRHEDALDAYAKFNGRWYGSRQLTCEFTNIVRWKQAICGQFHNRKCPKGKSCNFLHVFRNPGKEFWEADRDFEFTERRSDRNWYERSIRSARSSRAPSERYRRSRSRSRSPYRRSSRSRRSRSPSRMSRYRSRSRSPYRSRRHRSHSRSPTKSRRQYSRSPSKSRRYRSRSRSPSKSRRGRSKSRSPSRRRRQKSRSPHSKRNNSRSPSVAKHDSLPERSPSKKLRSQSIADWRGSSRSPSKSRTLRSKSKSPSYRGTSTSPHDVTASHTRGLRSRSSSGSPYRRSQERSRSQEKEIPPSHKSHKHKKKKKKSKKKSGRCEINGKDSAYHSSSRSSSRSPESTSRANQLPGNLLVHSEPGVEQLCLNMEEEKQPSLETV